MTNWRYWEKPGWEYYRRELKARALGQAPEMESAKQVSRLVAQHYRDGDSILDVGSGPGHYTLSMQRHLGESFRYIGLDITPQYLADASSLFARFAYYQFLQGDIFRLPFGSGTFPIVMCCNTIPHVPRAAQALSELARVARRLLVVRMLVGSRTMVTKTAYSARMDHKGEPQDFIYTNMYTEEYLHQALEGFAHEIEVLEPEYDQQAIQAHFKRHSTEAGAMGTTRLLDGVEAKGYMLLPWRVVLVRIGAQEQHGG